MTDLPDPPSYESITRRPAQTNTRFPIIARTNSSVPSIVHDDPLTHTWNDGSQALGSSTSVEAHLSSESYSSGPFNGFNAVVQYPHLTVAPPGTPLPQTNLEYIFAPVGTSGMALMPSTGSGHFQEGRCKYFITVAVNCFIPQSHITTVYRGNNELGTRVGYFEMGTITGLQAYLRIGDHPKEYIADVIARDPSRQPNRRLRWRLRHGHSVSYLIWDHSLLPFTCSAPIKNSPDHEIVAKFRSHMPSNTKLRPGEPLPDHDTSILEVTPLGHKCLDDIVISLLVMERRRLMASDGPFRQGI